MNSVPPKLPGMSSQAPATDWRVEIEEQGRCGSVLYREPAGVLKLGWEFGGGDTVAIISCGDEAAWRAQQPWTDGRRAEILQRVAAEVIRQKAPGCRAEVDARTGFILIRAGTTPAPAPPRPAPADPLLFRTRLRRFKMILAVIVLLCALAFVGLKSLFSIRPGKGTPLGLSVRTPEHIATLIQTLEPYVPSLHRNPANDRYRVSLFLHPLDAGSAEQLIPLVKQRPGAQLSLARLLGGDGTTVWFSVDGIGGVQPRTGRRIGAAELRGANPELGETWDDPRHLLFSQRLRLTSADRQRMFEVDPGTLKAVAVPMERDAARFPSGPAVVDFLSSGVRPAPDEWLGLHSPKEAERDFKPGMRLAPLNNAEEAKELRRFHRGQLGEVQAGGRQPILSMAPVSSDEFLNAAFVRSGARDQPLRLSGPDGFLMIYTSGPGLGQTLMVARVDADGNIAWKADTGIDRYKLSQILPDARFPAFIGTRPPVPDKVPEPVLVTINTQSGEVSTCSLWR